MLIFTFMEAHEAPTITIALPPEFEKYIDARIAQAVAEALQTSARAPRYLTRKEVCQSFSISLPTLSRYVIKGILQAHKIGSRVLFDESELTASLKNLQP